MARNSFIGKSLTATFIFTIFLLVAVFTATQAATSTPDNLLTQIAQLDQDTKANINHRRTRKVLRLGVRIARKYTKKGQHYLDRGKEAKARQKFITAWYAARFYQLHLNAAVQRGRVAEDTAAPLREQADSILAGLENLISGQTNNTTPVANAGADQSAITGDSITLDGSASSDADGDALNFSWTLLSKPQGSAASISDPALATTSITADMPGQYIIQLTVNDGIEDGAVDETIINVDNGNTTPVANAGPDQSTHFGDLVTLDGSASSDVDGDTLSFNWQLTTKPQNSTATLDDPTVVNPGFRADLTGEYIARLQVNDGQADSTPDEVIITTLNTRPVANAGSDQNATVGDTITLDASGSSDADGDSLSYQWALTSKPDGSNTVLQNLDLVQSGFVADVAGQYIVQVIVSDGSDSSDPNTATISIEVGNTQPIANAGADQSAYVGDTVTLDGSTSSDADSDTLSYQWAMTVKPQNSVASLNDPTVVNPTFVLDESGQYVLQLFVNDSVVNSDPDQVIISTLNSRPIADAGSDQTITVDNTVNLDGSASADADHDPLTYQWALTSQPEYSQANIVNPDSITPNLVVDEVGFYVVQLIVNDGQLASAPVSIMLATEPVEPLAIQINNPAEGAYTNQLSQIITGQLNHRANLTVNGETVSLANDFTFSHPVSLNEGENTFSFTATNALDQIATSNRHLNLDVQVPVIPNTGLISISAPDENGLVTVTGNANSVEVGNEVTITNTRTGQSITVTANANGNFSAQLAGQLGDTYNIFSRDAAGNNSKDAEITTDTEILPPDPETIAPPLNPTESTSLAESTAFLYTSSNPIQTGVVEGTIEARRVAIVRGKVLDKDNAPLSGVIITIKDHPELGQTLSRANGEFDLAVNGGGLLTINYQREGYLPLQRQVQTPWQEYAYAKDVVMTQLDSEVTSINLNDTTQAFQVAQSSVSNDADGQRQAKVFFPQGTTASMTLPDGTVLPLINLKVRATEYTVGENGPKRMPGPLPPASGYTYAVELSVDEAITAGAKRVDFSQPLPLYVDNFLNFPVGETVPVGWYDSNKSAWIPSENGRIIKILNITGGQAELDVDGDNVADTGSKLSDLGITMAEQQQLASQYVAGKSLWRSPITHFTPWDCNWPYGPSPDDDPPPAGPGDPMPDDDDQDDCTGCSIQPQSQSLGEKIPVTGTPFNLHYQSKRMPGYQERTIEIPISGESVASRLRSIKLTVFVAGQVHTQTFPPLPNQSYTFVWDGKDSYGRPFGGQTMATISIEYRYPLVYYQARSDLIRAFARVRGAGAQTLGSRGSTSIDLNRQWRRRLTGIGDAPNMASSALGGWGLDVHHAYDPSFGTHYKGNGLVRYSFNASGVITTIAGIGARGSSGDGGPAIVAGLQLPEQITTGPDGSLYIADTLNNRIRRVTPDGIIDTVAGTGASGYSGDGGPAVQASLKHPSDVAFGPDGSLYIADGGNSRIRRIKPDGIIETVAGTGTAGYSGDSGPAKLAQLSRPKGLTLGSDGSLYIADTANRRIRHVSPEGIITTFAGRGDVGYSGDGGPARLAHLNNPFDVVVGPDSSLYIVDSSNHSIRRITPDGIIDTVVGTGTAGYSGNDGGPAKLAQLNYPRSMSFGPNGNLYIADTRNHRIRRVTPNGIITTIAGTEDIGSTGDGGPANQASLNSPHGIAFGPNGNFYISVYWNHQIRRIEMTALSTGDNEYLIPDTNGNQLFHYNKKGHHQRTLDAVTGTVIYQFRYDAKGRLTEIEDADGDIVHVERIGEVPTAIIAPDGQRTTFTLDGNGYLNTVTDPESKSWQMEYTLDGLMTAFTDRNNNRSDYGFNDKGRLISDVNSIGGGWNISGTEKSNLNTTSMISGENRVRTFKVEILPGGKEYWRKTNTATDGSVTVREFNQSLTTTRAADGTITSLIEGPDARFRMQSPIPKTASITVPSGLTLEAQTNQTATLGDVADLFSHTQLSETTAINGRSYQSSYETATLTWTSTSPESRTSITTVNDKNRPVLSQVNGLNSTSFGYDARGRLDNITQGEGTDARPTILGYDTQGYLESTTDALDRTVTFQRDSLGRIQSQTLPDNRTISYTYDANGNLTSLTPPGKTAHVFNYTAGDQQDIYTPPALSGVDTISQYSYNKDKQLTQVQRPDGESMDFNYNTVTGQLDTLTIPRGNYLYGYDITTGQLNTVTSPQGGSLTYTYDGFLNIGASWSGNISGSVTQTYDNNFWITSRSVNGSVINYGYDNDALLTQAGDLAVSREAKKGGLISGTTMDTLTTSHSYNGFGELQNYNANNGASSLYSNTYVRDKLGRIKTQTETIQGSTENYEYGYDLAGRLTEVKTNAVVTATYGYDNNGNRNGGTYDEQDRLLTWNGNSYTYTLNGELKTKIQTGATSSYIYDVIGNLTNVTLPGDVTIDYVIDGKNRRVGKKVNGTPTQGFLYKDLLNPIAELDGNNNVTARFIYADKTNVPAYMIKGGKNYRIISDHLGSPRLVIDTTDGTIIQRMDYNVWGKVALDTNPGFQPFGFAGGLYDQHTQLVRFGARDYDSETGRWTNKDPIRFAGGDTNLYGYVLNDPVNLIDSFGLKTYGITFNVSAGWGAGGTAGVNFVADSHGNVGVQTVTGYGGDTPGLSGTVDAEHTTADNINDLNGWGFQTGVDGGEVLVGEGGFMGGDGYTGMYVGVGVGAGTPIGFSGYVTDTDTLFQFNIQDLIDLITGTINDC